MKMRLIVFLILFMFILSPEGSFAQCSMCTKTAAQLGEKPAKGMNAGIMYLMMTPFVVVGIIGYRWWKGRIKE